MKNKKKTNKRKKINWKRIFILGLLLIMAIIAAKFNKNQYNNFSNQITENKKQYEYQLEEKNNQIKMLEEEKTNLNTKIEELNKEIETLKTARAKTTSVTSRSNTTKKSQETVQVNATPSSEKWIWANVSAYCPCAKCCGKTNGITASGTKATAKRTIAAPKNYAFGTKIEIAGMGVYTVEDRGGAITGNKIDVYFNTHQEALQFGRRNLQIKVVE